uniref:MMS19 nucleotide excision repair protein n=1 Tax=Caenorhabditis japonica TaxID=281687 RepID=A0A8R1J0T4_CAEJA
MFPFILQFAAPLNAKEFENQFATLLPIMLYALRSIKAISSTITISIPIFLTVSGLLEQNELQLIVNRLCSIVKDPDSPLTSLENSLHGLNILTRSQTTVSHHIDLVLLSVHKLLGHKKRLIRMLAANVKNNWERQTIK